MIILLISLLFDAGEISFSKTQNRSLVAGMNKGCEAADIFDTEYNTDKQLQDDVANKANKWVFIHINKDIYHPNDLLPRFYVNELKNTPKVSKHNGLC